MQNVKCKRLIWDLNHEFHELHEDMNHEFHELHEDMNHEFHELHETNLILVRRNKNFPLPCLFIVGA